MTPVFVGHAIAIQPSFELSAVEHAEPAPEGEKMGPIDDVDRVHLQAAGRLENLDERVTRELRLAAWPGQSLAVQPQADDIRPVELHTVGPAMRPEGRLPVSR